MRLWLAGLVMIVFVGTAKAQLGIYAMGSAGKLSGFNKVTPSSPNIGAINSDGNFWAYGATAGFYDDFLRLGPLKLGADVRGFIESSSNPNGAYDNQLRGVLGGLRLSAHVPLVPIKPYVQGEIGAASTNYGQNSSRTGEFAYQVQMGGDFTIFPHIDLRAEYGIGQMHSVLGSTKQTLQQLGGGLVVRF